MTTWQLLSTTWVLDPTVLAGCVALLAGYWAALRGVSGTPHLAGRAWLFALGVAVLAFALVSPLDTLGDRYLFSAHMLQHLLLILVVPPLLLTGIPPALIEQALRQPLLARTERVLGQPLLAWLIGMATLWIWHLPTFYDAVLVSEPLHIMQHLSFLVTSTIFWWPVVAPTERQRMPLLASLAYLFAASLANSLLGILISFAPAGLYAPYVHPVDTLGILPLLRQGWEISPATDQQIGGLLMWIPGGMAYLFGIFGVLARWYSEEPAEGSFQIIAGGAFDAR